MSAFGGRSYNEVNVMLQSPAAFDDFVNAIKGNPLLHVKVEHEAQLAEDDVQQVNGILNFVSYFVGAILALAATIGSANSMYAMVEIVAVASSPTLRAIGFPQPSLSLPPPYPRQSSWRYPAH